MPRAVALLVLATGCGRLFQLDKVDPPVVDAPGEVDALDGAPDMNTSCVGQFQRVDFAVAAAPYSIAIADLDGDTALDLLTTNNGSETTSRLRYAGNRLYAMHQDRTYGGDPRWSAVGQFDRNAGTDIATILLDTDQLVFVFNDGSGGFGQSLAYTTGDSPFGIAPSDLDSNGVDDVAVAGYLADVVSVFYMDTNGVVSTDSFATQSLPLGIAIADLNGDTVKDIAVPNYGSSTVTIAYGPVYSAMLPVHIPTGNGPNWIAIGNLDTDPGLDIVTADYSGGTVTTLISRASGGYAKTTYPISTQTYGVALGDFNNDGHTDVATTSNLESKLAILYGSATGALATPIKLDVGMLPYGVVAADLDKDGLTDLVTANQGANTVSVLFNCPR